MTDRRAHTVLRSSAALAAASLLGLGLAACGGAQEAQNGGASSSSSAPGAQQSPIASSDEGGQSSDAGGASASDGGGQQAAPRVGVAEDPDSLYYVIPLAAEDHPEKLGKSDLASQIVNGLETDVDLACADGIGVGERTTCEVGGVPEGIQAHPGAWDAALVRTVGDTSMLIVRSPGKGAPAIDSILDPEGLYAYAYMVGSKQGAKSVADALEQGIESAVSTDGPSDVDASASCETPEGEPMTCEVKASFPKDAAGTWTGWSHDSFIEDSQAVLFTRTAG